MPYIQGMDPKMKRSLIFTARQADVRLHEALLQLAKVQVQTYKTHTDANLALQEIGILLGPDMDFSDLVEVAQGQVRETQLRLQIIQEMQEVCSASKEDVQLAKEELKRAKQARDAGQTARTMASCLLVEMIRMPPANNIIETLRHKRVSQAVTRGMDAWGALADAYTKVSIASENAAKAWGAVGD